MTESSSSLNPPLSDDPDENPTRRFDPRTKTALAIAALICFSVQWFLARLTGVPAQRGFSGSLFVQPSPVLALLVAGAGLIGCALLMCLLQGRGDAEDAIFGGAIGLAAISCRGGTMTSLLQYASGPAVFISLLFELVLLGILLVCTWKIIERLNRRSASPAVDDDTDWQGRLSTLGVATVVMALVMLLLAQTDEKKQALAAVGISAFAGAAAAFGSFNIAWAPAYMAAPFLLGVIGYAWAFVSPGNWTIGQTHQPWAFALPLDYASIGVAGALLGLWSAMKWKEEADT